MSEDILINISGDDSSTFTNFDLRNFYPNDGSIYKVYIENFNFISEYGILLLNLYIEGLGNIQNSLSNTSEDNKLSFSCSMVNPADILEGIIYSLNSKKFIGNYSNCFNNLKIYFYDNILETNLTSQTTYFNFVLRFKKI